MREAIKAARVLAGIRVTKVQQDLLDHQVYQGDLDKMVCAVIKEKGEREAWMDSLASLAKVEELVLEVLKVCGLSSSFETTF